MDAAFLQMTFADERECKLVRSSEMFTIDVADVKPFPTRECTVEMPPRRSYTKRSLFDGAIFEGQRPTQSFEEQRSFEPVARD